MPLPPLTQKLIATLRHDLRELAEYVVNAISKEGQSGDKPKTPPEVRAVVHAPEGIETRRSPADAKEQRGYQNRNFWLQFAIAVFTAGAFGAAIYYAWYAKKQWTTMNDTYVEIRKQTVTLQQQTEGLEAAVLQATFRLDTAQGLRGQIMNLGRVICPKVTFDLSVFVQRFPSQHRVTPVKRLRKDIYQLKAVPAGFENQENLSYWLDVMPVSQEEYASLNVGRSILLEGTMQFDNGFGTIITEPICWVSINLPPYKRTDGTMGGDRNDFTPCEARERSAGYYWNNRKANEKK
jgi:hypothetical protein